MKHTASLAQGTGVNQSTYGPKEDGDIDEQMMLCLGVGFGDIAKEREREKMMKEFRDLVERRWTQRDGIMVNELNPDSQCSYEADATVGAAGVSTALQITGATLLRRERVERMII